MAARRGPDAGSFPHRVGGAVLPHLPHRDVEIVLLARRSRLGCGTRHRDRGRVHISRMRAVEMVLEHQLPVAVVGVLEHAARDLELAAGRAIDDVVERSARRPEELLQVRSARRGRGEDEAAVHSDAGDRLEFQFRNIFLVVSRFERHRDETPAAVVTPAVIRADEALDIAPSLGAYRGAAVRAAIHEHGDFMVFFLYDDDGFPPHAGGVVVAWRLDLAVVPQHQPGAAKDALHLEIEHPGVGIHRAVHAVRLHQHAEPLAAKHSLAVRRSHGAYGKGIAMSAIALEASGVKKVYLKNGRPLEVLDVERFAVREGEFITVIGPSGCGKSTFLHIMGGFIKAQGSIRVYGQEVSGPGPDRGMMFQEFALFPWRSVAGNIAWGLEAQGFPKGRIEETVSQYLEMMGLGEFRNHYPAELSGGMKQRVALARVLAFDPKVLLMDEPFGALDAQTRETMQEELTRLWERTGKTIVFVTHDIEEAVYLGDRVVVLTARPGRIREEVEIALPRPRDLTINKSIQCHEYRNYIWDLIRSESAR